MNYANFEIAFWHPFGPHGGESPEEIIERKRAEIEANGWTLWSFQYRRMLNDWHRKLSSDEEDEVFVFCSDSRAAKDPASDRSQTEIIYCKRYRFIGGQDTDWRLMPGQVKIPHPFRSGKKLASAFVVQRVIYPDKSFWPPAVEWLKKEGPWRQDRVPSRGEYLIRRGGTNPMRSVRAILELKPPYLAVVTAEW